MTQPVIEQQEVIRQYVLDHAHDAGSSLVTNTCNFLGVDTQTVEEVVTQLEQASYLNYDPAQSCYQLGPHLCKTWQIPLNTKQQPLQIWQDRIASCLTALSQTQQQAIAIIVTSLIDNSIRHAQASVLYLYLHIDQDEIMISLKDDGQGLLHHLQQSHDVAHEQDAWLLACSGQHGTSLSICAQLAQSLAIDCNGQFFSHPHNGNFLSLEQQKGTTIRLSLPTQISPDDIQQITQGKRYLLLGLLQKNKRPLARQQAEQALTLTQDAKQVIFNFEGVQQIALTFADSIFREFALAHPHIHLDCIGANQQVQQQIQTILERMQTTAT